MEVPALIRKQAQTGFTLVELIVVLVLLGILGATALPRMVSMSGESRIAKMKDAESAIRAAQSSAHAAWLVAGGVLACTSCGPSSGGPAGAPQTASVVTAEGLAIATTGGYPDVVNGGIGTASGLSTNADYVSATAGSIYTVTPDAAHPQCKLTYKEAVQSGGTVANTPPTVVLPVIDNSALTTALCN